MLGENIKYTILLQIVNVLYGLIVPRTIILNYGSEINGLSSTILQLIGYMKIVEAGLSAASIKQLYKPISKNDKNEFNNIFNSISYYYKQIGFYFIMFILLSAYPFSLSIAGDISKWSVFLLIVTMALSVYFDFYYCSKYYAFFIANNQSFLYSKIQIITQILKLITIIILANFNFNIIILFLAISFITYFKSILLKYYFEKQKYIINKEYKKIKIENRQSVFIHQLLSLIIYNSPLLIISFFYDLENASIYSIYNMVFGMFYTFASMIFAQSILPIYGHLFIEPQIEKISSTHNRYTIIYNSVIFSLIITSMYLFKSFLGFYTKGADINYFNKPLMIIFILQVLINCLKIPYQTIINAKGDFYSTIKYSVYESVIYIISIIILMYLNIGILSINIALTLSFTFKYFSLKIYVNKNYFKETKRFDYSIFISFIISILLYLIYNNIFYNINSVFQWIFSAIILTVLFFSLYTYVTCKINKMSIFKMVKLR